MAKREIVNIVLESPDGGVNDTLGVGGILASLLRSIYAGLNIKPHRWHALLMVYVRRYNADVASRGGGKTLNAGNLPGMIFAPRMSWGTFWRGIRILNPIKVDIQITLWWAGDKKHEAKWEVVIADKEDTFFEE